MKKSTKIITTAVALVLVVAAMVVGIYAATSASATITAQVNWTATAGVEFTLSGKVVSRGTHNSAVVSKQVMESLVVTSSTTNTESTKLAGTLNANFADNSNDGVNNPGLVEYEYEIKNDGDKTINVKLTKYPVPADESNVNGVHKPKVEISLLNGGVIVVYSEATVKTNGIDVAPGKILLVNVYLSMASGGTGSINADTSLSPFDAGVTFSIS